MSSIPEPTEEDFAKLPSLETAYKKCSYIPTSIDVCHTILSLIRLLHHAQQENERLKLELLGGPIWKASCKCNHPSGYYRYRNGLCPVCGEGSKHDRVDPRTILDDLARERQENERLRKESDAEMERVKACEHIADGDEGWEALSNLCPSTASVASLRNAITRERERAARLEKAGEALANVVDEHNRCGYDNDVLTAWEEAKAQQNTAPDCSEAVPAGAPNT